MQTKSCVDTSLKCSRGQDWYMGISPSLSLSLALSLVGSFSLSLILSLYLSLSLSISLSLGFSPSMYMDAGWLPQCNLHPTLKLIVLSMPYTNLLKPINGAMMHTQISVHSLHHALRTPKAKCPNHWVILSHQITQSVFNSRNNSFLVHLSSILIETTNVCQRRG